MPRVASTINISNPKRYGYDVRIDDILLRSAVGPGREMQIQSSDVQEGQINVKQNPEDFTSNLGRIYSRNDFSGGSNLDIAHRANGRPNDNTRFWDSQGVDVFNNDLGTAYNTQLLHTTEREQTLSSAVSHMAVVGTDIYVSDDELLYKSTDGGDNFSVITEGLTAGYQIKGLAAHGDLLYITANNGSAGEIEKLTSGGVSTQGVDQITGYSASGTTVTFSTGGDGQNPAPTGGVSTFTILFDIATANTQVYTVTVIHNGIDVFTTTSASSSSNITINSSDLGLTELNGTYQIRISADAQVIFDNIVFTASGRFEFETNTGSSIFNYTNTTASSGAFTTPNIPIFDIQNQMPEIKVIDFLTALFKMFNLVAFVNSSGQIEVRTLDNSDSNSYYHSSNTTTYDITKYVNIESSTVDVALPYKEIKYAYEDLKSYLSIVHQQLFNEEWGTVDYNQDTTANFIDGQSYKIIIPFSHFKFERLLNIADSTATSIQWGWSVNENQEAYKDKPLVFYPLRNSGQDVSYLNPNNQDEPIANYNIPSNSRFLNDTSGEDNIHFNAENNEYDRPVTSFSGTLFKNYYENYITRIFDSKNRLTKIKAKLPLNIY